MKKGIERVRIYGKFLNLELFIEPKEINLRMAQEDDSKEGLRQKFLLEIEKQAKNACFQDRKIYIRVNFQDRKI